MAKDSFEESRKEWSSGFVGYKSKIIIKPNPVRNNWVHMMLQSRKSKSK